MTPQATQDSFKALSKDPNGEALGKQNAMTTGILPSATRLSKKRSEFGEFGALRFLVAALDRFLNTVLGMNGENLGSRCPQGGFHRSDLMHDIDAVPLFFQHADHTPRLALDPPQTSDFLGELHLPILRRLRAYRTKCTALNYPTGVKFTNVRLSATGEWVSKH